MYRLKSWSVAGVLVGLLCAPGFGWEFSPEAPLGRSPRFQPVASSRASADKSLDVSFQPCSAEAEDGVSWGDCDLGWDADPAADPTIGGWLSAGVFSNAFGAPLNGPLGFNDVTDFNVHQLWVYAEKAVDTGGYGTDWGYRVDFMFGIDAADTQAFGGLGWDTTWDTSTRYGFAMPQLYAEFGYNDLTIKAGHFYTLIGYEVVPSPDNFFYTHAYTMFYGEPFTHTGVLASYAWSDDVTIYAGWTQGWDTGFDNTPGADTFLGGISLPLTDKLSLTWAVTGGSFGPVTANKTALGLSAGDVYMNSFVFTWALNDRWTYVFQHDLGVNWVPGAASAEWYGINQYLQWKINDCWAAGLRVEWFRDDDGARISFNGPAAGNYGELTAGVNWKPNDRLVVRPEIRYDWFGGKAAAGALPFDNGNGTDQFSGGFDFYVTY